MRQLALFMFSSLVCSFVTLGQTKSKLLKVYCITEYIDGYVIKGVDTTSSDTLNIISVKKIINNKKKYKKIIVGEKYNFEYTDYISSAASVASSFVLRIKSTIVWRNGDDKRNKPVYSENMKDLWIKKTN